MRAVIFAGGVGTRLWPLSRKKSPKQFEKIIGDKSTLQLAATRLLPDFSWDDIYISTGQRYTSLVHEQLPDLPADHVIGEPAMRDVGPAVGLVTSRFVREAPDEPMVILWSDHMVKKDALFRKILRVAGEIVKENPEKIVFVSQKPRFPSENLGWIEYGKQTDSQEGIRIFSFVNFQYRPDKETAKRYFKSGHHAWNLGYFVTTPRFLWKQYEAFVPNIYTDLTRVSSHIGQSDYEDVLGEVYPKLEKISFDNAILEKLSPSCASVISENIEWSDVGAWEALKEALEERKEMNVSTGRTILTDTRDSLVYNYTKQLVATIDLDGMLVVCTDDVILVCKKDSVPKIKTLVESMNGTENDHLT